MANPEPLKLARHGGSAPLVGEQDVSDQTGGADRKGGVCAGGDIGVTRPLRAGIGAARLYCVGFGAIGGLLTVWYVPHVITLREVLFVIAFSVCGYLARGWRWGGETFRHLLRVLATYLIFLGWMLLVITFVSPDKRGSLAEFWHEWIAASVCFPLGALFAAVSRRLHPIRWESHVLSVLVIPLTLLVGIRNLDALFLWVQTGAVPWQVVRIVQNKHDMSILANLLVAVMVAEALVRLRSERRVLPLPGWLMGVLYGAALFSNYLGMSRNGNLELIVITGCGLALFTMDHWSSMRWHSLAAGLGVVLVLAGGFYATSVVTDPRWTLLVGSIRLGWDSERHLGWLDPEHDNLPTLPDGRLADGSAFERTANLKEALKLAWEHPWGWNIDRDGFHRLVFAKYQHGRRRGASLYGWLDIAIMVGVVGLGLWLAFLIQAGRLGWRTYARQGRPLAALLLLVVVAFGFRSGIDSIVRDHFLEQFMFLVGALVTGATLEDDAPTGP